MNYLSNYIYIGILLLSNQAISQSINHTLIFIDKSSSNFGQQKSEALKYDILKILESEIKSNSHLVTIAFIHSSTNNLTSRQTFSYEISELETKKLSSLKAQKAELKSIQSKKIIQRKFATSILNFVEKHNSANLSTNLFGSLRVIQELAESCSGKINVFYLSDMVPYNKRLRYYGSKGIHIQSYAQAKELAKKNLKKEAAFYDLQKIVFKKINKVQFIFPKDPLGNNEALIYMPVFWTEVFLNLGVSEIYSK